MIVISSLDNFKIKEIKKLHNKKYRDIHDLFLIEGEHLVREAFSCGFLKELIIEETYDIDIDVKKTYVSKKIIKYLSTLDTPSNMIGICEKKQESEEFGNRILILDNIQDAGNLGTIIRSAFAFNASSVIISEDTVDLYNEKTLRSSQGLFFKINVVRTNLVSIIEELKLKGYYIYGTDVKDGIELNNVENRDKSVIIIGNEGQGLKEETKKVCDQFINIKMNENCESINAAVAASIILYKLNR